MFAASRLLVVQQAIRNRIRAINHIVPLTSFDYIKRTRTNWISQQTGEGLSCEDLIPETSAHPRFEIMFAEFPQLLDVWGAQNNSKNDELLEIYPLRSSILVRGKTI